VSIKIVFYFALKYMTGAINEAGEANDIVNPFLISNAYFQSCLE
jgi:hypothetical protein